MIRPADLANACAYILTLDVHPQFKELARQLLDEAFRRIDQGPGPYQPFVKRLVFTGRHRTDTPELSITYGRHNQFLISSTPSYQPPPPYSDSLIPSPTT